MGTGRRPRFETGRARPDPTNEAAKARAERAESLVQTVWADHPPQRQMIDGIRRYMRVAKASRGGPKKSVTGRRLSQVSQAGKSATFERLKFEVAQEEIAAGKEPNEHRVIHITLDDRMTLKMLYQEILNRMADEFVDEPSFDRKRAPSRLAEEIKSRSRDNIKILEQRVEEWVIRLGVELIVVDEVQRLAGNSADAQDVTKKLMSFLDRGVVAIVFIGDETSKEFFSVNDKFAARLLKPLVLPALGVSSRTDLKMFKKFCGEFDRQLVALDAMPVPSCLVDDDVLDALFEMSGGHVGRVARLIQVALPDALAREAMTIERYDLSNAIRDYVIDLGWIDSDPFSRGEGEA